MEKPRKLAIHASDEIWTLEEIQKQLSVIKRLNRNEFVNMPIEQRENYISIVERIAGHLSKYVEPQNINMKNSHLILEALYEAKMLEMSKQKALLAQTRNNLIQVQQDPICTSIRRVLFQYKRGNIKTSDILKFIELSYLLKDISIADLSTAGVILMDLTNIGVKPYCIEECILFTQYKMEFKKKIKIPSEAGQAKRQAYLEHCQEIDKFNKNLSLIWEKLNPFEQLKYFCKPEYLSEFDVIIDKGKSLNLSNQRIIQLILDSNLLDSYQENEVPYRIVEGKWTQDITNLSLEVATKIQVPEQLLLDNLTHDDLKKGAEHVENLLGLTYLKEFQSYWREITYFDSKMETKSSKL